MTAAVRTVFGCEPEQVNALFALTYAQAGGGFLRLSLTEPGCAQEKKIKVRQSRPFLRSSASLDLRVDPNRSLCFWPNVWAWRTFD